MKRKCSTHLGCYHGVLLVMIAVCTQLDPFVGHADAGPSPELVWESMGGPPGGGVAVLAQSAYAPNALYAGAACGLFVSYDQGTTFQRVGDPELTGVNEIQLAEEFAVVTADAVYAYDYETRMLEVLLELPFRTLVHGGDLYVVSSTPTDSELEMAVFCIREIDPALPINLEEETPLAVMSLELPVMDPQPTFEIKMPTFLMVDTSLLLTVALIDSAGTYTYAKHEVIVIDRTDGSYQIGGPHLPDDLVLTRIAQDPEDARHLILAARNKRNGDTAARPIADLVYESTDGGITWGDFTDNTFYQFHMIKDVEFHDGRIFFPRVGDWILSVDQTDPSDWEQIGMPSFGTDITSVAWLEWLKFDAEVADVVYGGLDLEAGFTGLIRSRDDLQTWEIIGGGVPSSQPSNIDIHPNNPDILVTSGNIAHYPHITRDGGQTWERLLEATSMGDELRFDPHDPNHLILVSELTDLYETWDMGETWQPMAERFHGARIADLAASGDGSGQLFAALFGIGISRFPNLNQREAILSGPEARFQWEHLYGSSDYAYDLELDPEDSRILYASYSPKVFETTASVFRYDGSQGATASWETLLTVDEAAGISSLAINPLDRDRLYAGVIGHHGRILTSGDRGIRWEPLCKDLTFSTIHEMAMDPTDDQVVYAAPWGGGLFKTTDAGTNWTALSVPTVSVAAIVIDPDNPEHVYIGDRTRPAVFETPNGGAEWVTTVEFDSDVLYRVSAMALHQGSLIVSVFNRQDKRISLFQPSPMSGTTFRVSEGGIDELPGAMTRAAIGFVSTGERLYAVSHIRGVFEWRGGLWADISVNLPDMGFNAMSADRSGMLYLAGGCDISVGGPPRVNDPAVVNNIYRSSDQGETWEPLIEDNEFGGPLKKVLPHPAEPDWLVAASASGIFVSRDHGRTWDPQNQGLSFRNIGALAVCQDRVYAGTLGGGVFMGTIDESALVWEGTAGPTPDLYNLRVIPDPSQPQVIYVTAYPGGVFKSTDAGTTWVECNFGLPSFQVADPFLEGYYDLAVNRANPDLLFLGIYGYGIYVSRDGAATWFPIYAIQPDEPILRDLSTKRVVFDPTETNHVYVASEQGVFFTPDLGNSWEALNEGLDTLDIISLEIAEDGSVFAGSNGYGAYVFNESTRTWTHMNRTIGFGEWAPWERRLYTYTALLFDPTVPGRIYLGNFPAGFFVSNDNGHTWECSSRGLGNDGIFSLAMQLDDPQVLFAGTYNGIWKTDNQGATWFQTSTGMPGEQWPFCVVIDDQNASVMYTATKNGMNKGFMSRNEFGGVVMKTTDGGESWFAITKGLPVMSEFYQLIIHPDDHDRLFLSSTYGVFTSRDAGASWEPFNEGLPVDEFYVRDNVAENLKLTPDNRFLVLGITAHGVWRVDLFPEPTLLPRIELHTFEEPGSALRLSWRHAAGWGLWHSANLIGWDPYPVTPTLQDAEAQVLVQPAGTEEFFRLEYHP